MPIFEYECKKCGHRMEFLERSSDSGRHNCEKCGSKDLHKLLSTFSAGQSSSGTGGGGGDSCPTGTCPLG